MHLRSDNCNYCILRLVIVKAVGEDGSPLERESVSQLEIFQLILQKQCDAMVALGVNPSIRVSQEYTH